MAFLEQKMQHGDAILPCPYITMLYWHINMPDRDIVMPHPSIMRPYCTIKLLYRLLIYTDNNMPHYETIMS